MLDNPPASEPLFFEIAEDHVGTRLDVFLSQEFSEYSRVYLRRLINAAHVKVNDKRAKAAYRLKLGERIEVHFVEPPREGPKPEPIDLDIIYEDEHLAAVNKPPQMVVHPAKGHWAGTLASALAYHFQNLSNVGGPTRPGIVHRLDRDTSGVIVVAKTNPAHMALAKQFENRTTRKEYFAIVVGEPDLDRDSIDEPIGAHPYRRERMAIRRDHATARDALTFYEVIDRFKGFAAVRVTPKTGRTHQIRVHLMHAGYPVLCDRLYGGRAEITQGELIDGVKAGDVLLHRQALHARKLEILHPASGEPLILEAQVPDDIQSVWDSLKEHRPK